MADDTNQLRVRLVTPERTLFEHTASAVELPSKSGYMEVLYGHAPLMAELGAGDVIVHGAGGKAGGETEQRRRAALQRQLGICRGAGDRVTILA